MLPLLLVPLAVWFNSHQVWAWIFAAGAGLLLFGSVIYTIRSIIQSYRLEREMRASYAERQREEHAFVKRARRAILMGEEWEVDVTRLRTHVEKLEWTRKVERAINYQRDKSAYPLCLGMLLLVVSAVAAEMLSPEVFWKVLLICLIGEAVAIVWFLIWWIRYRRFKQQAAMFLKQVQQEL